MSAKVSNEKATHLLDEARRLIASGGMAAVTHRSVESAARVPHGSVTYYFGNRDGLVSALVDRMVAECEAQVAEIAANYVATGELAPPQFPHYFRTVVNEGVARSLDLRVTNEARSFARLPARRTVRPAVVPAASAPSTP